MRGRGLEGVVQKGVSLGGGEARWRVCFVFTCNIRACLYYLRRGALLFGRARQGARFTSGRPRFTTEAWHVVELVVARS